MSRIFSSSVAVIALLCSCTGAAGSDRPRVPISLASDCDGVQVAAGARLPDLVEEHPAGTTFCLSGAQVIRRTIVPKDGQRFLGPAVLAGAGVEHAFTGSALNVVLAGLTVEGFEPPVQDAAVDGEDGHGWVMERLEVRRNGGVGVSIGTDGILRDSYIHHNAQLGIKGRGARGLVERNEIAYNNHLEEHSWGWEAGGSKFWSTTDYVVRDNDWHHNAGPGIWFDNDNTGALIERNTVTDNYDNGIFYEISYDAVIRDNVVRRNGFKRAYEWLNGAGIMISASGGVVIEGNTVEGNKHGIVLMQQDRGTGEHGPYLVRDVLVRRNTVDISNGGQVGLVEDVTGDLAFSRGNRFEHNSYELRSQAEPQFAWADAMIFARWRDVFPTEQRAGAA